MIRVAVEVLAVRLFLSHVSGMYVQFRLTRRALDFVILLLFTKQDCCCCCCCAVKNKTAVEFFGYAGCFVTNRIHLGVGDFSLLKLDCG